MRGVRRSNTAAERLLQERLRQRRVAFTRHGSVLECRPDLVLNKGRIAIFVDGDFWHGRILVERGRQALSRSFRSEIRAFWVQKIERNVNRDRKQTCRLRRHGWSVIRLWERDVLKDPDFHADTIERRLRVREATRGPT
jgi:DNA mismatch endonuclease (patch repair protein)